MPVIQPPDPATHAQQILGVLQQRAVSDPALSSHIEVASWKVAAATNQILAGEYHDRVKELEQLLEDLEDSHDNLQEAYDRLKTDYANAFADAGVKADGAEENPDA